jgi:hypothetical protein
LCVEERKFALYKQFAKEKNFRRLANTLPYQPLDDLLIAEVLQFRMTERPLFLALQMHLHFVIACQIVEVTSNTSELLKLVDVFQLCHKNLLLLIDIFYKLQT